MAVKYAVANGNWNAGATWNDGVVPVDGDVVYCNNHSITADVNIALQNTILTNELCPTTNVSGGHLIIGNNRVLTFKECYAHATYIFGISNNITCMINADIFAPIVFQSDNSMGAIYSTSTGNNKVVIINGNCYGREAYTFIGSSGNHYVKTTINGNVILKHHLWTGTYSGNSQLINGSVHIENAEQIWVGGAQYGTFDLTINGDVTGGGYYTSGTNGQINIGGSYYYTGYFGFSVSRQVNFSNPNAEIKYIGAEPNPNYYVILAQQELNNRQQYPPEDEVKEGTEYVWGEKVGTYQQPPESVVLKGFRYDNNEKEGTLENENIVGCVTPEDVRKDVPLVGMGVVGSLVVPSVDDVREGVIFDNGSVGTLIVQGGGDRLRIADFGYYTNAQSDTYIVDLTEQDKPKFAVAEERVLIEMFPDLDLNNIPEKYFDDLFVKYLKYRLIVEYYRTAGINSTFTPSEPTTEIVNYQNVRNEVWLNSANIYLKAWAKKYPESITKPQRILL